MLRAVTIKINLSDEDVSKIVPSADVWVEIYAPQGYISHQALVFTVEDIPGLDEESKDESGK